MTATSKRRPDELWDGREWGDHDRFHEADRISAFVIHYGAIPSPPPGGFLPAKWESRLGSETDDEHASVLWWSKGGWSLNEAIEMAHESARHEAERYIGDWKITVRHRTDCEQRKATP